MAQFFSELGRCRRGNQQNQRTPWALRGAIRGRGARQLIQDRQNFDRLPNSPRNQTMAGHALNQ